jgi:predicted DNA-binding transcriptional regulator AlpA
MLGVSTVTLWTWRKNKLLPEPTAIGPRFIGWRQDVVEDWLQSQGGDNKKSS